MNKHLIITILIGCLLLACARSERPDLGLTGEAPATVSAEAEVLVAEAVVPAPEVTAPEVTAPEVTAPEVTAPEVTAPEILSSSAVSLAEAPQPMAEDAVSTELMVPEASDVIVADVLEEGAGDQAYFSEMLGESTVAASIAQPEIPQNLRPPGVPILRPGRLPRKPTPEDNQRLLASIPKPLQPTQRPQPPKLLPDPEPELGVIYVVPFVSVMVPREVEALIFDRFVDTLNEQGESLGLQFVILKEGLRKVGFDWLAVRKYVTGEVYAYVEDSGCCNTDLRARVRLTYFRNNQMEPEFRFEYPVQTFFDHDRSTIEVERIKLAKDVAATLAAELLKAIQN